MKYWILGFIAVALVGIALPWLFLYSMIKNRQNAIKQQEILYDSSVNMDILGNINGDLFRDCFAIDKTKICLFNNKEVTISASIGQLIVSNNINIEGKIFSLLLSLFSWQKNHCLKAYNLLNLDLLTLK